MRHIDIAKEAFLMIGDRITLMDKAKAFRSEVAGMELEPDLKTTVQKACDQQIAAYEKEQKLLGSIGEDLARMHIQKLPIGQQKEAIQDVKNIIMGLGDFNTDPKSWDSVPELRTELSTFFDAIKNAPETLLEQQDKPDPAPVQGITMEEGHAVARDGLDQAVEVHATPSVEPDALPPSDPSPDIERGIEQEQFRTETPNQDSPGRNDKDD